MTAHIRMTADGVGVGVAVEVGVGVAVTVTVGVGVAGVVRVGVVVRVYLFGHPVLVSWATHTIQMYTLFKSPL